MVTVLPFFPLRIGSSQEYGFLFLLLIFFLLKCTGIGAASRAGHLRAKSNDYSVKALAAAKKSLINSLFVTGPKNVTINCLSLLAPCSDSLSLT
jgi:hypothetical protein